LFLQVFLLQFPGLIGMGSKGMLFFQGPFLNWLYRILNKGVSYMGKTGLTVL
jgi:hypothetical protein